MTPAVLPRAALYLSRLDAAAGHGCPVHAELQSKVSCAATDEDEHYVYAIAFP